MPSAPDDRPTPEVQDIRELFARSGKRPTRRFDEITTAAKNQQQTAATKATTEDNDTLKHQDDATPGDPDRAAASGLEAPPDAGETKEAPHEDKKASISRPPRFTVEPSPAPADSQPAVPPSASSPPDTEPALRRRSLWAVLAAPMLLVTFGLGGWLGHALAGPEPDSLPDAATQTSATQASRPVAPSTVVPKACLDTATLGDQIIDLLVAKRRGPEVDAVLQAYVTASQQCRAAASR
jgi:hypothetical protein